MQSSASQEPATAALRRKVERCILWDLLLFTALLIPLIVCEFVIEPARRGFFCNDESIRYPFRTNTVSSVLLGVLVGVPALAIFFGVEFVRQRRSQLCDTVRLFGLTLPSWLAAWIKHLSFYTVGVVLTLVATEVGKYTIGRLRPHFMAVCQPQLLDGSTCADAQNQYRYIEDYTCAAQGFAIADVRQARLSFPSGHSSLIFYGMVYLALFLQRSITWRGSRLALHLLQFTCVMVAWFTALSRVLDNMHHWSDVLVGALIGVLVAILTAHYVAKLFSGATATSDLPLCNMRRQDTSTTLNEVITSTPPPYITKNGNSCNSDDFDTKI